MSFLRVIERDWRDRLPLPSDIMVEYMGLPNMAMAESACNTPSHPTSLLELYPKGGALTMIIQPSDGCKAIGIYEIEYRATTSKEVV
jgi:hypothetical protein